MRVCARSVFFIWPVKRDLIAPIKPCEIACGSLKWEVKTNANTRTQARAHCSLRHHTHSPIDSIIEQTTGYKVTDVCLQISFSHSSKLKDPRNRLRHRHTEQMLWAQIELLVRCYF